MKEQPKVTVLMPSLNVGAYIRECMESVVRQSLQEIEILCIDAGSTDGTLEVLREYADRDPRVTLLHSGVKSYGHQINMGLDAAKGEYIGIVETDDYIDPDMYRILWENAEKTGKPDIVKAAWYSVEEGGKRIPEYAIRAETGDVFPLTAHRELIVGHPSIWSCIYRKFFLRAKNIRMQEEPGGAWVDNPFLFRTMCEAERICWVNEPLYSYRRTNPNSSTNHLDSAVPMARINDIKDYLEASGIRDRTLEKHLCYRTLDYVDLIREKPRLTKEDRQRILRTLKRFDPLLVLRMAAGRKYRKVLQKLQDEE